MTRSTNELISKTNELEEELKATGLWIKEIPAWVLGYDETAILSNADFAQWYQDIIYAAELADHSPVRGSFIIRPYGY